MGDRTPEEWWQHLPAGIREEIDGYVLQDAFLAAVRTAREGGCAQGLDLNHAQRVVGSRYDHHGSKIARTPDSPLDLESLTARAAGLPGRLAAIEAVWDGDTLHDWFVILLAVTAEPAGDHRLATIYHSTARRWIGQDPAAAATKAGQALAAHLAVPFFFASPDTPDDDAPRWQPPTADDGAPASPAERLPE